MRFHYLISLITASAMGLSACSAQSDNASARSSLKNSPIGKWERSYKDDIGQDYFEVLEIFEQGFYVKHGGHHGNTDKGRYVIEGKTLSLRSDVDQRHSRDLEYKVEMGKTLTTEFTPSAFGQNAAFFKQTEIWARTSKRPYLQTVEVGGRHLPISLPGVLAAAHASEALPWRPDAVPTKIGLEERPNGYYETEFEFFSPSAMEIMRIKILPYRIEKSTHDGSRARQTPLPPTFMDLFTIIENTKEISESGITRADLYSWGDYGPVWRAFARDRKGGSFSAETGVRTNADVTGYIEQYNADGRALAELWRKVAAKYAPKRRSAGLGSYLDDDEDTCDPTCWQIDNRDDCIDGGGNWSSMGSGSCN